ncbi:hypothetical protein GOODEAATRI_004796 [Goodea atripinnis]|uniref:Uncharacterized protein n=1 Tax=Goodea atripinnis TaxID=208336 RepID=A0ABV0PVD0_9TELE
MRRPHCSFHLPTPLSACCWHHYLNTNTVFLSSSPGRDVLVISLLLLQPLGGGNVGLKGSGTWVAKAEALQLAQVNLCHRTADLTCHKICT